MIEQSLAEAPAVAARSGLRRIMAISASLMGTTVLTNVLGLLFWLLAARRLAVSAVGVGGAAISSMTLLGTLGTFGLGTLLIARLPQTSQGSRRVLLRTTLSVAGAAALLLGLLVPFVAIDVLDVGDLDAIAGGPARALLFAAGTALTAVTLVADQAVLVLGNGSLQTERNAVASSTKLVVLVGLTLAGQTGGMTVFLAWSLGLLVSLPLLAFRTRGGRALEEGRRLLDPSTMRGMFRPALSHHGLNTMLQLPLQLLPIIVLVALSKTDNGIFTTAVQVTGPVFVLPYSISVALFAAAEGNPAQVLDRMRVTIPLGLGLSLLADLIVIPFAPYALSLFGSSYSEQGATVLRVLVLAGLPFVVKDHFVALRRVQGRTGQATLIMAGLAVLELAAGLTGAHQGGTVGLCVGWVGVLFVEAAVFAVVLLRSARPRSAGASAVDVNPPAAPADALAPLPVPVPVPVGATPARVGILARAGRAAAWVGPGPALLLMTLGLLPVAAAVSTARAGDGAADSNRAQVLYVLGLLMIFLPAAFGVLLPGLRRSTRISLAIGMAVLLQLSRTVLYPTRFMFHDELAHATVLHQIGATGRLFTPTSLLPVTAYYPGLEVVTDAVRDLAGLSAHTSAVVVLLAARLILALAIVGVVERLTGSARVAATALVVYACNPQMLFFNSQFSYQSLALPLMVLSVYLIVSRQDRRASLIAPVLTMVAVAITHHVTMGLLVVSLGVWAVLEALLRRRGRRIRSHVGHLALLTFVGVVLVAATVLNPGNSIAGYLGAIVTSSAHDIGVTLAGHSTKHAFQNSAGVGMASWEKYVVVASLLLTLLALLPALVRAVLSREGWLRRRHALGALLCLTALLYPVIPGGHLTVATAEVGDRSAGFVFLGVAFVVSWWLGRRSLRWWQTAITGAGLGVVFLGSIVLGAGPFATQLPGPFEVSYDARSIDADNLAAARWEAAHLPEGARAYADRDSGLLAAADGGLYMVRHIGTGIDASRLLLDPRYTADDVRLIRAARIRYLIVDRRDANGLPNLGVYIESGEYAGDNSGVRTAPVPVAALEKFDGVRGVERIYDNGSIVIYDLGALDGRF